jgi:copper chaperone NosL
MVRYGESTCAECRMIINEARYAAAALTAAGEPALFDSTECLVRAVRRDPAALARMWVHDYGAERWLAAEEAFFVASPELTTPMGGGVVALATASTAEGLAAEVHGRVMRFAQLRSP